LGQDQISIFTETHAMKLATPARSTRIPLLAAFVVFGLSTGVLADLTAGDSYAIGSDPTLGQYQAGVALKNQPGNLTNPGFATGPYNQGSQTSNFQVTAGGLSYPPYGEPASSDGKVSWIGAAADNATRSVGRLLNPVPTSSTYWFNILVSQDGTATPTTNGYVLSGFGNSVPPLLGTTAGNSEGLFFGFAQHGTASNAGDLVIRYRSGTATNSDAILVGGATTNTAAVFDVVARLDVNYKGGSTDYLTYWVNPAKTGSQSDLDSTSLATNDTSAGPGGSLATLAFQSPSDLARLTYSATNWTGHVNFDEPRLGTALADVVPALTSVPEPGSLLMLGMGLLGGLGATARRRARARAR